MTRFERLEAKLLELCKFEKYYLNFFNLTDYEQSRVLEKHENFRLYYRLYHIKMVILRMRLSKALSSGVDASKGRVLEVEDLSVVMKLVTFDFGGIV